MDRHAGSPDRDACQFHGNSRQAVQVASQGHVLAPRRHGMRPMLGYDLGQTSDTTGHLLGHSVRAVATRS
jgi:hypothetical protein